MIEFLPFKDRTVLVTALARTLENRFKARLAAGHSVTWAVSGGSTPEMLFKAMGKKDMKWRHIHVCLVDERWVPPSHPRSNEAFIARSLLKDKAAAAPFSGLWTDNETLVAAAKSAEKNYRAQPLPIDSVLLGMGPDGHTASLFPGSKGLEAAFDLSRPDLITPVTAVRSDVTGAETQRLTLTAKAITDAGHVALMLFGAEKRAVFEKALEDENLPVTRLIKLQRRPVQIYWAP